METFCCTLKYVHLLVCIWVSLALNNVDGCFKELNTVSPRSFVFEALPSINASLGEKLELRCFVDGSNSTSVLMSMSVHSRSALRQLNATCKFFANGGECRYTIPEVKPWHQGKYDCIKIYKDKKCFSKTLELSVSSRRLRPSSTSSTVRYTYTTKKPVTPELDTTTTKSDTTSKIQLPSTYRSGILVTVGLDTTSPKRATTPTSGSTWTARYWTNNIVMLVFFVNFLF